MKAIAIVPGRPETAGLIELPEPSASMTLRKGPEEIKIVIEMAGTV